MRRGLDTADRSFLLFLGVVVAPYVLLFAVACGLVTILGVRFAEHGLGALTAGRGDLRPAAAVLALLTVATVLGVWSLRRQVRATSVLVARVGALALPVPDALHEAAAEVGLVDRVEYLDSEEPFSFAYGLARPRVVVSRGLFEESEREELRAVLEHERYHVRRMDPLKVVVARAASAAYFFLPALRGLRSRYAAASELAADRRAIRNCGRGALAGALYRAVRGPSWDELSTAAAIGGPELLDVRIRQIESGHEPPVRPVSRVEVFATGVVLAVLGGVLLGTVVALGGPGAMMREAMGPDSSMDGDMGTSWGAWGLLLLLLAVSFAAWRWSRRRRP